MRMIVTLFGIYAFLSICLNGEAVEEGLVTVYLDANNPDDIQLCPSSHILPRATVPFETIDDVKNWVLCRYSCYIYLTNNDDIKYEEMHQYHNEMVIVEDGDTITFTQFCNDANDYRYLVNWVSSTITILEFNAHSISLSVEYQLELAQDFGFGIGQHCIHSIVKHKYNENGEMIYYEVNSENAFVKRLFKWAKERNAAFQISFGDHIDYFNNNNEYGIYINKTILFIVILLLLSLITINCTLCVLYKRCCSRKKGIKYEKVTVYDVESSQSES